VQIFFSINPSRKPTDLLLKEPDRINLFDPYKKQDPMKLCHLLLAFTFATPCISFAQYSAKSVTVTNLPVAETATVASPQWKKEQDQVNGHISDSKLAKMKNVTGAIAALLQDSYFADGSFSPVWHAEYFSEKTSPGPFTKFGVECDFPDQSARLSVTANDISPLLGHLAVNNQDFLTITTATAVNNDGAYFEGEHSKTWLIAAGDHQLPYMAVTRKEYLQESRKEVTIIKNSIIDYINQTVPVRPLADQETEKKATIDRLTAIYSGVDLQIRIRQYLNNYLPDEEYRKESIKKETAGMDSTLHLMDSLLDQGTAKELDLPAIVSVVAAEFRGFEDGHSDKMLIRMNAAYFNGSTRGETPQFFLVTLQLDGSSTQAGDIDRHWQEKFDGRPLKDLLKK
jgi:hypothetical protein